MARHRDTTCPAILFAAEAEPGIEVGEVINELVERIRCIFKRGCNREAVSLRKEAHNSAAECGHARGIDQAETPPEHRHASGSGELAANRDERTTGAIG